MTKFHQRTVTKPLSTMTKPPSTMTKLPEGVHSNKAPVLVGEPPGILLKRRAPPFPCPPFVHKQRRGAVQRASPPRPAPLCYGGCVLSFPGERHTARAVGWRLRTVSRPVPSESRGTPQITEHRPACPSCRSCGPCDLCQAVRVFHSLSVCAPPAPLVRAPARPPAPLSGACPTGQA